MILYAEDDKIIVPQKKILLTDDIQQNVVPSRKIILPEDIEEQDEYTRREFMMFSLACMGMLAIPSRSNANPALIAGAEAVVTVARGVLSFVKFIKHSKALVKIYNRWKRYKKSKKFKIPYVSVPKSYNPVKVTEVLEHWLGLAFSANGVGHALKYLWKKAENWDREGYALNSKGESYMNRALIHLENKTNKPIERKVRLFLVNENGQKEHSKQFTLSARPHDYGTFNVSEYFRKIYKIGLKSLRYDVSSNYRDVEVRSTNKNIVVSKLIV